MPAARSSRSKTASSLINTLTYEVQNGATQLVNSVLTLVEGLARAWSRCSATCWI